MPGRGRGQRPPDPAAQELPEFPPISTAGSEKWLVEYIEVGNEGITVTDYLVRNGIVTSEQRERVLSSAEVNALYVQGTTRTFSAMMDHLSGLAQ